VIDPENLRFVEYPTGHGVDLLGGGKVAAHRLFHNDARIGLSGANGEACMLESLAHGGKGTRWDAEIKNAVAGQAQLPLERFGALLERLVGLGILVSTGQIKQAGRKGAPLFFRQLLAGMGQDPCTKAGPEIFVRHLFAPETEHDEVCGKQTIEQ
jgi:hypothetical protein